MLNLEERIAEKAKEAATVKEAKREAELEKLIHNHQAHSEYRELLEEQAIIWANAIGWTFTSSNQIKDSYVSPDYMHDIKQTFEMRQTYDLALETKNGIVYQEYDEMVDRKVGRKSIMLKGRGVSIAELEEFNNYLTYLRETDLLEEMLEQYYHICPHCGNPIYATHELCNYCNEPNEQYDSGLAALLGALPAYESNTDEDGELYNMSLAYQYNPEQILLMKEV